MCHPPTTPTHPCSCPSPSQVLNIGINNLQYDWTVEDTVDQLGYLLTWLQAAWPASRFVLHNLLPTTELDVGPANEAYEALAAAHNITWSTCGSELDPTDPEIMYDGLHPAADGYRTILCCLASEAAALLAEPDPCWAGEDGSTGSSRSSKSGSSRSDKSGSSRSSDSSTKWGSAGRGNEAEETR